MCPTFYTVCLALASVIEISSTASSCVLVPLPNQTDDSYFMSAVLDSPGGENSSTDPLRLILINSELEFDTVVSYVSSVYSSEGVCSEVLGVVGDLSLKTAGIISTLANRTNLSVTLVSAVAPSSFVPVTNLDLPNVLDTNPLTHYVEAFVTFCKQLNWTRIALISDDTVYYQFAAELLKKQFLQNKANEIIPCVTLNKADNLLKAFDKIKAHGTYITVVLMNRQNACLLLEAARSQDLVWPEYAWVVLDIDSSEETGSCYQKDVILFRDHLTTGYNLSFPCDNDICIKTVQETNLSLDSPGFLNSLGILTAHNDMNYGFHFGEVSIDERRLINISILFHFSKIQVAFYSASSGVLEFLHSDFYAFLLDGNGPQGKLLIKYQTLDKILLAVVLIFAYLFITTTFALYIYFRGEPEIKATSVTVSLLMFLGCFLMLTYVPLYHVVHEKPLKHSRVACHSLLWLCAAGLSTSLVLSTLIVKMIRVYAIFSNPFSIKKKLFSDAFLGLYIILMTSPNIFIQILWLAVNPQDIEEIRIDYTSYTFITQFCLAESSELPWYIAIILHTMALSVTLIILAFKTAYIRYQHFQDSKETNAYAFIVVFTIVVAFFYWWFHLFLLPRSETTFKAAEITSYVAHIVVVSSCQIYLFVPKVYSPLKRLRLHQKILQRIRTIISK